MSTPGHSDSGNQPVLPDDGETILEVEDLSVAFYVDGDWFPAAIDVSYDLEAGEVLAIVGESGSGKTQSAMSLPACCRRTAGPPAGRSSRATS